MSNHLYAAYVLACLVIIPLPGPTVTLIVGNSMQHGARAGLLNVAGTQLGVAVLLTTVLVGLGALIGTLGWMFDWLRLAGAAYLIWLGWKLLRASGDRNRGSGSSTPRGGFMLQGLLVMLANPKGLLFFGAFLPQFIDPHGDFRAQALLLGATAMLMGAVTDSAYALLAGRAQSLLSRRRALLINRAGGACLIGGGIWLAFTRAR
ncbi:MAG TPA: LysE family translocator [Steroidobacteraceae bacterium]|nr:LysE family translocator [Steroidobacteraceae bacterium]